MLGVLRTALTISDHIILLLRIVWKCIYLNKYLVFSQQIFIRVSVYYKRAVSEQVVFQAVSFSQRFLIITCAT